MNFHPLTDAEAMEADLPVNGMEPRNREEPAQSATGSTASTGPTGSNETPTGSEIEPTESFLDVLKAVRSHFESYVMTMTEEDLDILTLWTIHTHLCFETYTTPRLILDSAVHGSGKTTVLEHIERLGMNPVQMSNVSSPAMLARILDQSMRTILIDEADRSLNPQKPGIDDIIAIINSGYKRGASRPVLVPNKEEGWVAKEMPTFSPVAMAGNAPQLPDDTKSRSLTVLLMPAQEGDVEETDWEVMDDEVKALGERLAAAADRVREQVKGNRPNVPKGCIGRMKERWLPLKRVAAAASDAWAERVDHLILRDLEAQRLADDEGIQSQPPHVHLARDIHTLFERDGTRFIETSLLLERLIDMNPDMWSKNSNYGKDITAQRLSRFLVNRYGIHSSRVGSKPRGYYRDDFKRAWAALKITPPANLTIEPVEPVQPVEPVAKATPAQGTPTEQEKPVMTSTPRPTGSLTGSDPSNACKCGAPLTAWLKANGAQCFTCAAQNGTGA